MKEKFSTDFLKPQALWDSIANQLYLVLLRDSYWKATVNLEISYHQFMMEYTLFYCYVGLTLRALSVLLLMVADFQVDYSLSTEILNFLIFL